MKYLYKIVYKTNQEISRVTFVNKMLAIKEYIEILINGNTLNVSELKIYKMNRNTLKMRDITNEVNIFISK